MKSSIVIAPLVICVAYAGFMGCASHNQQPLQSVYKITDLGVLRGYATSKANGISSNGVVVGECSLQHEGPTKGFVYQNGRLEGLQTAKSTDECVAKDINDTNWIVGYIGRTIHLDQPRAALWIKGKLQVLDVAGGGSLVLANAINNQRQIVGQGESEKHIPFAYIWQNGMLSWTKGANGTQVDISDINDRGEIVVNVMETHPTSYIISDNRHIPLTGLGSNGETANAINNRGEAVGLATTTTRSAHACLWRKGQALDLGVLRGNESSQAYDINNQDQIVGSSYNGKAPHRAVLWTKGQIHDLNSLIPKDQAWTLHEANGLNDKGQIVGTGIHHGKVRAYLLTPLSLE